MKLKIGDYVTWWQTSEWDNEVPREGRGIVIKVGRKLYVRDLDSNDYNEINDFKYKK